MSGLEQYTAGRRRRRGRNWPRVLAMACLAAMLFVVGVALGMALRDDPEPGGTVTIVRTLEPLPQTPATTP
jgi:hypothetical protein